MAVRIPARGVRRNPAARALAVAALAPLWLAAPTFARGQSLSADSVATRAAERAPAAEVLESEAAALCCELDSRNATARQQVGLMQRVLQHLADHQRNEAAGAALVDYFRILGLQHQLRLTQQADEVLLRLKNAAEIARQLDIPQNGTAPEQFVRQGLQLEDQRAELSGGITALKISLAGRIGAPLRDSDQLELGDELIVEYRERDADEAVDVAWRRRQDLQAIDVLCSCLNRQTVPAARAMLGVVRPGLGLSTVAEEPGLLPMLHGREAASPRCRSGQCALLQQSRRQSIEAETRAAVAKLHTAYQRLALADDIVQSFEDEIENLRRAAEATETPSPQVDRLTLELLEAQGRYYVRLAEARIAEIELQHTQGILSPAP